ncbi:OsmC family protein [Myxococcota bacterium]|nr:OsmC family protein [Myxococcota bacterium]
MSVPGSEPFDWAVRVVSVGPTEARAYARNHTIVAGEAASLRASDPHPSAIEYLLAALGTELLTGLRREAQRSRVELDAAELSLSGRLDNPLVLLGVVGEEGRAGLSEITGRLYVSTDAEDAVIDGLWKKVLSRAPVFDTLSRATKIAITVRVTA